MSASRFQWTDGGAQSLITDLHVQRQIPKAQFTGFGDRSIDNSVIEVVTVGSAVNQVTVTIQAERDDTGLRDLQAAMIRGLSFTYTPDNASPGTTFTVTAVPVTIGAVGLDRRGRQDMFTLTATLARLDGGAFAPDV